VSFFPVPDRAEWLTLILAPYGEDPADWTFPCWAAVRGGRTKIFPKRGTMGPTDFDRDDTLSTANWQDLSGGSGINIINPSTDMGNTWWHIADARGTDGWTCPPEAIMRKPGTYTGNHVPLGRIGATTYGLWGTQLHKWDPDAQTWGNSLGTVGTVVNTEGIVTWMGAMYLPLGANGYATISESAPGTPVITVAAGAATPTSNATPPTSAPRVWAFGVHQQKLWGLTYDNYQLFSLTLGGNWFWPYDSARSTFIKVDSSAEPKLLFEFVNIQQGRALWCSTRRGCLIYDPGEMTWQESNLWEVPPHPDFGRTAKVFRPGEAAWISSGGGDLIQYQATGVVVPASGPGGAKQGMPAGKRGSAVSMASDLANLFLLMKGETALGTSDAIVEDASGSDPLYLPQETGISSVIAWTGKGFHPLWESAAPGGVPTKIVVSDAVNALGAPDYRTFWGLGEESWSMPSRLTTHSSRQAVQIGTGWRFATSGYIDLGEFSGGSLANRKLISHAALFMRNASSSNYAEYEYQTDADPYGTWRSLGQAAVQNQRVVLPFGLSADGLFSEGLACNWIAQRVRLTGSGGTSSPVVGGLSLSYMPLPQDAATKTYTIPLPIDVDPRTDLTREQIIAKLEAHVESERFLYLKHQERTYRAYVASVADTGMASRDASGTLSLVVIQIPVGVSTLLGED
jgi:hypothetical protein